MHKNLKARDMLSLYPEDVRARLVGMGINPEEKINLEMDDGVHETTGWRLIYSTFCWNFQRVFSKTPLTIKNLLTGRVTSESHLTLMNHGYWETYEAYGLKRGILEYLDRLTAKSTSTLRNYIADDLQEFVVGLHLGDYIELVEHPIIKQELDLLDYSRASVSRCHDRVAKALLNEPALAKNKIVQFVRSKFINMQQVLQCISAKGFQTRVDSRYYDTPILNNFLTGLNTLYEAAVESTSATKAIRYSADYVEKGEYFQRKMQLAAMPITDLVFTDCGTTKRMELEMREELLHSFEGKEYEIPETGERGYIWADSRHLIGKKIKVRTVLHCRAFSKQQVCSCCFGYMSHSIVENSNLGLVSISELCRDASQSLLGVKHNDFTTLFQSIVLGQVESQYLACDNENPSDIRLQEIQGVSNLRMVVEARYLYNLTNAMVIDDVEKLTLTNTTSIHNVELWFVNEDGFEVAVPLVVAQGSRMASFSLDMIRYIRGKRWTVLGGNRYVFDLTDWETDKIMFSLPMQSANMLDYIKTLEVFIRSSGKNRSNNKSTAAGSAGRALRGGRKSKTTEDTRRLVDSDNIEDGLLTFNSIVSSMLSVNIVHQEIAIASMTAVSETDSRFPVCPSEGVVMPYETLIRERSISGIYSYEHHEWTYGRYTTYLNRNRMYHPMDWIFAEDPELLAISTGQQLSM